MEEKKKMHVEGGDKEILYSKAIKAGKRIYYLDVKKNLKEDLFLAITESKKVQSKDGSQVSFEKHKIFLYREDFDKFLDGIYEVFEYIRQNDRADNFRANTRNKEIGELKEDSDENEFNLDIEF